MDYKNICINCMHEKKAGQSVCSHCGFDIRTYVIPSYVLPPFTILDGKYLVGKVQGIGGFGITYLAMDLTLEHPVAIKEYYVQSSMYRNVSESSHITLACAGLPQEKVYKINRQKFESEAKTLASLSDLPGIVRVTDYFLEFNTAYIVMEYLSGRTLKRYVTARDQLSLKETREMLNPVMTSLQYVHERKILHRDISPDNMKVLDSGLERGQVKLYDFGGARQEHGFGEDSKSAVILKKDGYTPIEQIAGAENQGPWTDVYAMAATIYFCICGKAPVSSSARVADPASFQTPRQLGVPISKKVEDVLLKGLAVQVSERYQSMREFQAALEAAGWGKEAKRREKVWPFLLAGGMIAAAGVLLLAAHWLQGGGNEAGNAAIAETGLVSRPGTGTEAEASETEAEEETKAETEAKKETKAETEAKKETKAETEAEPKAVSEIMGGK